MSTKEDWWADWFSIITIMFSGDLPNGKHVNIPFTHTDKLRGWQVPRDILYKEVLKRATEAAREPMSKIYGITELGGWGKSVMFYSAEQNEVK